MKILFSLLIMLSTTSIFAEEIVLRDHSLAKLWPARTMSPTFNYNKSLERAWVEVSYYTQDDWASPDNDRIKVEGLSFDAQTHEVILEKEGARIICSERKKNIFGYYMKETKKCLLKVVHYNKSIDDGFEIKKVPYIKLVLKY